MPRLTTIVPVIIMCLVTLPLRGDERLLKVGEFSASSESDRLPVNWEPLFFKDIASHTSYSLVREDGVNVVRAESSDSSSGLTRKISIDPKEYPTLKWRWKIANVYEKGDVSRKEGDDYPARLYITFAYDPDKVDFWERVKFNTVKLIYGQFPPISAINYIWASKAQPGLITPNPYTDRVQMIVVESGGQKSNQWVDEQRDIVRDYREAFGAEPPEISGIAIMTDSDNTGEAAVAWYGDISFGR